MRVVKRFFEKHLLFYYMVRAFFKTLLISLLALGALFGAMKISGKYNTIEGMLDLKYDSPWIIVSYSCHISGTFVYNRTNSVFV